MNQRPRYPRIGVHAEWLMSPWTLRLLSALVFGLVITQIIARTSITHDPTEATWAFNQILDQ